DSNPALTVRSAGVLDSTIVYPDAINFGKVAPGCTSESRRVRITNGRDVPIVLASAELVQGSSAEYSSSVLNFPLNLPAHTSTELSITYTPSGSGADAAALEISEQSVARPYVVWISGEGDASAMIEERATQLADMKVDVLFVIEDIWSVLNDEVQDL